MSKLSRIELLQSFAEQEPENPFNWYALAIEFLESEPEQALNYFDKLLIEHKGYLPTYYHAAALFAEFGDLEKAKRTYEEGIVLAKNLSETNALRELQNAYQNFQFEYE
ncbi:tetratricopeptide repeat protein [Mongoliitalea daihaiensis]|uniref:tetratricopeptide repeat protein n=1 Tax=Mongoliitalea daihaiensis TaxID=2782006 RepID=UPI001F2C0829|nr:tetratricopeptide repeat protein [Mongoliitalea daihaiensis]UJP64382.1 tetratricopeptide repeat protein [Mongoliitalea daihaiensis]